MANKMLATAHESRLREYLAITRSDRGPQSFDSRDRDALRNVLDEIEKLRAELAHLRAMHDPFAHEELENS